MTKALIFRLPPVSLLDTDRFLYSLYHTELFTMGLKKAYPTIHDHGLSNESTTPKEVKQGGYQLFQYDVLAMHLPTIIGHATSKTHRTNGQVDVQKAMDAAARDIKRFIGLHLFDFLYSLDPLFHIPGTCHSSRISPNACWISGLTY